MRLFHANTLSCAITTQADLDSTQLHEAERALVRESHAASRVEEFTLGRIAARLALSELGAVADAPIGRGSLGEPLWPTGVRGSISHTRSGIQSAANPENNRHVFAAAIVGRSSAIDAIGIDIEDLRRPIDEGVIKRTCLADETVWVQAGQESAHEADRSRRDECPVDIASFTRRERLLFILACKEALFKALNPLTGVYLGFQDACVKPEAGASPSIALLRDVSPDWAKDARLEIEFRILEQLLVVWVVRPRKGSGPGGT